MLLINFVALKRKGCKNMCNPVDLSNLREMTDGDIELERELFAEFISSSQECISIMEENCCNGENEIWHATAHALKGTSVNLGAEKLGELCKKAQEQQNAYSNEKQQILSDIKAEYNEVKIYLKALL